MSEPPSLQRDGGNWTVINPVSKTENRQTRPLPLPLRETETAGRSKAYYSGTQAVIFLSSKTRFRTAGCHRYCGALLCATLSCWLCLCQVQNMEVIIMHLKVLFSEPTAHLCNKQRRCCMCLQRVVHFSCFFSLSLTLWYWFQPSHPGCNMFSSTCNSVQKLC